MAIKQTKCIYRPKKAIASCRCAEATCGCANHTSIFLCQLLDKRVTVGTCTNKKKVDLNCKDCKLFVLPGTPEAAAVAAARMAAQNTGVTDATVPSPSV